VNGPHVDIDKLLESFMSAIPQVIALLSVVDEYIRETCKIVLQTLSKNRKILNFLNRTLLM
jgi:hypothetical protein